MSKPIAVLISDVHYSLKTLDKADKAMRAALDVAEHSQLPLIVCGDLHDSKAVIRAECANAMLRTLLFSRVPVYILIGNHDLLNQRSSEHALHFLASEKVNVVGEPETISLGKEVVLLLPYQDDPNRLEGVLNILPYENIIMHQGVKGANAGEYILDPSAVDVSLFTGRRVISGHYHKSQQVGPVEYVGTPYTVTFAEANDGLKGFKVLYDDFTTKLIPLDLPRHVIVECHIDDLRHINPSVRDCDYLWLKVTGDRSKLQGLKKQDVPWAPNLNFKLDKIYTDRGVEGKATKPKNHAELLDALIDETSETDSQKAYLKSLWRDVQCNSDDAK